MERRTESHTVTQTATKAGTHRLTTFQQAMIQLIIGIPALAGGVTLIALFQDPTVVQATIFSGLFSFGAAMLAAFFTGRMEFKHRSGIIATGSFALFLVLLWMLRNNGTEASSQLLDLMRA